MKPTFGFLALVALPSLVLTALTGCGSCPLVQFDVDNNATLSAEELAGADADALADTLTRISADPVAMLLCASYLQSIQLPANFSKSIE
jgi:hypothetical protein